MDLPTEEWILAVPCISAALHEFSTVDFVCSGKCHCEQSENGKISLFKIQNLRETRCLTWKVFVACDEGNIPCSWNNCMTSWRLCSSILRCPFSDASVDAADLGCEGVFGVRGERSMLSSEANTAFTQTVEGKIKLDWNSKILNFGDLEITSQLIYVEVGPKEAIANNVGSWWRSRWHGTS